MGERITMRDVRPADLDIVAGIFTRAQRTLAFLPQLHSEAEDRAFVRAHLFPTCRIRLAVLDRRACGFVALDGIWIRQLHVDPGHFGMGIGSTLIRDAKHLGDRLELWTFQDNRRARHLYERHGFVAAECTDGTGNAERVPDVRYVWEKARDQSATFAE